MFYGIVMNLEYDLLKMNYISYHIQPEILEVTFSSLKKEMIFWINQHLFNLFW